MQNYAHIASSTMMIPHFQALVAFKKNCSAFLDHKDDFDVDTIHDSLPQHLRDMVMDEPPPRRKGSRGIIILDSSCTTLDET